MPAANITLARLGAAAGANVTVNSRNFSPQNLRAFLNANHQALLNQIGNRFGDLGAGRLGRYGSAVVRSTTSSARIWKGQGNQPNWSRVKKAVLEALQIIDQSGGTLTFPGNSLDVYVDETHNLSLGYAFRIGNGPIRAAIVLGQTAVQVPQTRMNYTVAWEVYKHYRPTKTVNALNKMILTTTLHEIGHVLHQLNSLEYYITLARCSECGGQGDSVNSVQEKRVQSPAKFNDFNPNPANNVLCTFIKCTRNYGADVSNFAYQSGLNELVAETFAALVMGVPIGSDNHALSDFSGRATQAQIMTAYPALGGQVPPVGIRHARGLVGNRRSRARLA
jgi:hypothetical protein